jgi:hypothetical protein
MLVDEHNHNNVLKEAVYPLDKKNRINIRKIKDEMYLKPPIVWTECDCEIGEDKEGWSDVTFEVRHPVIYSSFVQNSRSLLAL